MDRRRGTSRNFRRGPVRSRPSRDEELPDDLPARPEPARTAERLLIAALPEVRGTRLLCTSLGRAQLAAVAARADAAREVVCTFFDLHLAGLARDAVAAVVEEVAFAGDVAEQEVRSPSELSTVLAGGMPPENLTLVCAADLPDGPFDAALVPLQAGGDSEFAWDLLQSAYQRLADGGLLFTAVDEPRDRWVAGRMDVLFDGRVARNADRAGIVYRGVKRAALKKQKEFDCEFAFRDRDHLVRVVSRPGVFSHRRLDLGARALIESLAEPTGADGTSERDLLRPGMRVLDLGCGAGAVGFGAALRAADVSVHAIDSMPRAVECAVRGAALNGLTRYTAEATAGGHVPEPGTFDLVLANPPYYSHHRIAELFVASAWHALKPVGRAHFVTRQPDWFTEHLPRGFRDIRVRQLRTYFVVDCRRRER